MDSPTETRLENLNDSCGYPQNSNSVEEISADHSSPETPKSDRIPVALSFGSGGSDVTPNHDSDSSYSELDSEAEAFYSSLNHRLVSPGTMDSHEKPMSYGELMKRFLQCEEELKTMSLKFRESQEEIEKLKDETEKKDSAVLVAENLRGEIETARREIEMRDKEIESEQRRVLELQGQVVYLETKLSESSFKIENLVNELEVSRECLDVSDAEISKLREMLCDCEQSFSTEKTKLQAEIAGLLEKQTFFEDQIKHSDAEKLEMQTREVQLQDEINALKTDLASRDKHTEALNKDFDEHKLRYDMLMAEKDRVFAELENLKAELRSRDIQIEQMGEHKVRYDMLLAEKDGVFAELDNLKAEMRSRDLQMEEQLNQMRSKQTEFVSESEIAKNNVEELRAMVKELEKQAELQRNAISEGEEEKREVIRQLCFTLDHYKSGYRELLRLLSSNNKNKQQQAIMVV